MRTASPSHVEDPLIPAEWFEKEVAVVGLGRTGVAVGEWLTDHGVRVYASDSDDRPELTEAAARLRRKSAVVDLGTHDLARIGSAAAVVASPGVAPQAPPLAAARAAGVPVVAELDLAARALAGVQLIVITGTNGKTTTTAMTAHLLSAAGKNAQAAGNIGRPLIELVEAGDSLDWVVVEASSFQLHDSPNVNPAIGVVTNLAPDHLDRYQDLDAYYADKKRLFQNATERSVWILNGDDDAVETLAVGVPGERRRWSVRSKGDAWWDRASGHLMVGAQRVLRRDRLLMLGDHNVENALAALLASSSAGVPVSQLSAGLKTFRPLPHRLEPVREVDGVLWINDSKATNVASTSVGLRAMERPFVLIAGGQDKGADLHQLDQYLSSCQGIVAYGEAAEKFQREMESVTNVEVVLSLEDAVSAARAKASDGDAVLLSPACASFDQFRDFEQRGDQFKRMVEDL